jgi:Ca2+-binding RTX toxin-like protein
VLLDDVAAGSNDVITLTATNDIDVSTVDSGTATATLNAGTTVVATAITAGALDVDAGKSVTQTGAIDVDNLVAITAGTTVNTGTIAANDVDIDAGTTATIGAITTEGTTATVDIKAGVVAASAITSNDVVIEATNDAGASTVTSITASGDITFNGGTFTQSAGGTIAAGSDGGILTISDTTITIADGNEVSADAILITGDGGGKLGNDVQTDLVNGKDATNDIDAEFLTGVTSGIEVWTGSGADDITANNDTIFSINTGEGNDTVTLTNADAVTLVTGAGVDNVTVTAITGTSGATSTISTGDDGDTVTIENGVGSKGLTVNTGDGADTVTANDVSDNIVVNLGDGADSITTNDATATDINADGGNDTITLGKDSDANVDGGTGTDTLVLANNDYSDDDLVISDIEVLNITAGNDVELSAETFAGDNTFELVGTGDMTKSFLTITATDTNDTTIDASGISTEVGSSASIVINGNDGDDVLTHNAYNGTISGGAGNDTIDGKAGDDIIIGGAGADDMTGGAGADDFKFGSGDNDVGLDAANNSMDIIRGFETNSDEIIISDFSGNWAAGGNEVDGSGMNDVGEVLELANDTLNGATNVQDVIIVQDAMGSGDSYVYIDANNDGDIGAGDILIIFEDATPVSGDFGP